MTKVSCVSLCATCQPDECVHTGKVSAAGLMCMPRRLKCCGDYVKVKIFTNVLLAHRSQIKDAAMQGQDCSQREVALKPSAFCELMANFTKEF